MENKKLGALLIAIAIVVGGVFTYFTSLLSNQSAQLGCYSTHDCYTLQRGMSASHFAIGIFSFLLALGFYLIFFNKTEEKIMKRLDQEKEDEKFEFALKLLDPAEAKVLRKIKEQNGITQSTLRLRADMSKAKLSYVLQDLEKRGLIERTHKGKTLELWLKI